MLGCVREWGLLVVVMKDSLRRDLGPDEEPRISTPGKKYNNNSEQENLPVMDKIRRLLIAAYPREGEEVFGTRGLGGQLEFKQGRSTEIMKET